MKNLVNIIRDITQTHRDMQSYQQGEISDPFSHAEQGALLLEKGYITKVMTMVVTTEGSMVPGFYYESTEKGKNYVKLTKNRIVKSLLNIFIKYRF